MATTAIAIRSNNAAPPECQNRYARSNPQASPLQAVESQSFPPRKSVNELIETHTGLARSVARRYRNRGIDLDDLEQIALLGLTKAARRFDADAGHDFVGSSQMRV